MTEQEAKKKWCVHTNAHPDSASKCDGSACMAWRWDDAPNPEYDRRQQSGMSYFGSSEPMYLKSETNGHCGLAGRP